MKHDKPANHLIHETSPYLLQHAHNPVDWYPWRQEALDKAIELDRPIIVSIGYSSCHWCHVMERQSFENEEIAKVMNDHFICIKVDREERPDVDQIYMEAVQAMGLQGGWPLNVFLTPQQKPFYGGTYFPPQGWLQMLKNVSGAYRQHKEQLFESAEKFAEHLQLSDVQKYDLLYEDLPSLEEMKTNVEKLAANFDTTRGGMNRAPKFPMPVLWKFLLRFAHFTGDKRASDQVMLTLEQIARGGIYDQIGGGFARYSVDKEWLVPHFEKMLYDNGQLVSLFAEALKVSGNSIFEKVIYQTIDFIEREMSNGNGGFYAALDADSEGEEGKYYVWQAEEIRQILGKDADPFEAYYNVDSAGNWEAGKNILHNSKTSKVVAAAFGLSEEELEDLLSQAGKSLLTVREKRVRPGLDNKILTGWNALMLKGLTDAFQVTGEQKHLDLAIRNGQFIIDHLSEQGNLWHQYFSPPSSPIEAYLDDYAFVIEAFTGLFEVTFDEKWLQVAREFLEHTLRFFFDAEENLFYYTSSEGNQLIARKKEVFDNVIPASNSVMARNLHHLGIIFDDDKYKHLAQKMLTRVSKLMKSEPSYMSNWLSLAIEMLHSNPEIVVVGKESYALAQEINKHFLPNKILIGAQQESSLPLLQGRKPVNEKTTIFVCFNKTCKLPVHNVNQALKQLENS